VTNETCADGSNHPYRLGTSAKRRFGDLVLCVRRSTGSVLLGGRFDFTATRRSLWSWPAVYLQLAHLAQASNFKTRNPKHGALDAAQLHADWANKLARTLGVSLASVAPSVWHGATGRAAHAHGATGTVLTELELSRAAQNALALAQREKSTWTQADVIKYLGRVLPRSEMDPAVAAALLQDLADRALRSAWGCRPRA
jgi:hypothetical protein